MNFQSINPGEVFGLFNPASRFSRIVRPGSIFVAATTTGKNRGEPVIGYKYDE